MLYSIAALGGMRIGEACGLRFGDIDLNPEPLGKLEVRRQYNDEPLKTERPRRVPLHPKLREILDAWRRKGFVELTGRIPGDDDFVCPNLNTEDGHWTKNAATKALRRDCLRLNIPERGTHAFRRFVNTTARTAAVPDWLIERVLRNPKGEVIDAYTDPDWATMCRVIQAVELDLEGQAEVVDFPMVASEDASPAANGEGSPKPHTDAPERETPSMQQASGDDSMARCMADGEFLNDFGGPDCNQFEPPRRSSSSSPFSRGTRSGTRRSPRRRSA